MAALKDLIDQIQDIDLRQKINEEVYKLSKQKNLVLYLKITCLSVHHYMIFQLKLGKK